MTKNSKRKILVFKSDDRNITFLLDLLRRYEGDSIVVITQKKRQLEEKLNTCHNIIEILKIEEFTPPEYDNLVFKEFFPLSRDWCVIVSNLLKLSGNKDCIASSMKYSFFSRVIYEKVRDLLSIERAIKTQNPCEVYADESFYEMVKIFTPSVEQLSSKAMRFWGYMNDFLIMIGHLCIGFNSLITKVIIPYILTRFCRMSTIDKGARFLLADGHALGFMQLNGDNDISQNGEFIIVRSLSSNFRRRDKSSLRIFRKIFIESFLDLKSLFKVIGQSFLVWYSLLKLTILGSFKGIFFFNNSDLWLVLKTDFQRYIIGDIPTVLEHTYIAENMIRQTTPEQIFTTYVCMWKYDTLTCAFQKAGINFTTYNHGLVIQPARYISSADTFCVSSIFEKKVLEKYNAATCYSLYSKKTNRVDKKLSPTANKIVLLSSNWTTNIRQDFIKETLSFLSENREVFGESEIVIKLHPLEDIGTITNVVNQFENERLVINVTKKNLDKHLNDAKLAFCLLSSIIINCIQKHIPFFVFSSPLYENNGTFFDALNNRVKYTSAMNLKIKYFSIINKLSEIGNNAQEIYFGRE